MLGNQIKNYISQQGLKYGAVAARAGISANKFSAMLLEHRKISAEEYFKICDALNVPLNEFARPHRQNQETQ